MSYLSKEIEFLQTITDYYLCPNIENSFVYPNAVKVCSSVILKDFVEILQKSLDEAIAMKEKRVNKKDFDEIFLKTSFLNKNYLFRGNRIKSIEGDCWALRKVRNEIPKLTNLGLPSVIINVLTNENLKSGLVLIVGETGNGKSTTCGAIINELCSTRGSFALTVEDPPELPLHGPLGKGMCIQTEVEKDGFADAIRGAMRSYPTANNSILYVGEIRDTETAKELIKVAANGHLVFTTIHGDSIISGLKRLIDMATEDGGRTKDVKSMLASSIRLVVHQQLKTIENTKKDENGKVKTKKEKLLKVNFVLANGSSCQVANAIEKDSLDQIIPSVINRQKSILESQGIDGLLKEEFIFN